MTDAVLADVAAIESITELDLSASHGVTDEGLGISRSSRDCACST